MNTLVEIGLANAAAALLLALLALAAGRVCKRPALVHGLWLLVLIKLVTPPVLPVKLPWLPPAPPPANAAAEPPRQTRLAVEPDRASRRDASPPRLAVLLDPDAPPAVQQALAGLAAAEEQEESARPASALAREPAGAAAPARPWDLEGTLRLIGWVWLTGSVLWFAWAAIHIRRFHHLLRHARPAPADLQEQARSLAARMGLDRCPAVWLLPGPLPPMVWAAVGPVRLFLPARLFERLDADGRGSLLAHELAHVCRRDHWVRWLELLVLGLYWWYPLVWWVRRQVQAAAEDCCDAWVVGELPPRVYAGAIVETVDFLAETRPTLPVMASGFSRVEYLKQRLIRIMQGGTPKRLSFMGRFAVVALAAVWLPLLPQLGRAEHPKAEVAEIPQPTEALPKDRLVAVALQAPEAIAFEPASITLAETRAAIRAAALSPDGQTLALALEDRTVQLRDAANGELRQTLGGHADVVTCLAFAPDGRTLATGSPDQTVRLWDADTGRPRRTLNGHTGWVYALAFAPDGRTLASAGYDRMVRLWDPDTGLERACLKGHTSAVRALAFAPDGKTLASGGGDRTLYLWNLGPGNEPRTLQGHEGTVRAAAFSPDGRTLASAGEDGTVRLWDTATGAEQVTLQGQQGEVWSLALSPRGRYLATGGLDGTVQLWDRETGSTTASLGGHADGVTALAFAPDGRRLYSAGLDRGAKRWQSAAPEPMLLAWAGEWLPVWFAVTARDATWVVVPGDERTMAVWRLPSNLPRGPAKMQLVQVIGAVSVLNGRVLAPAWGERAVKLSNLILAQRHALPLRQQLVVRMVAFPPDGRAMQLWLMPLEKSEPTMRR
jgi:beta-lactamase regulating signal transducer with metallopeptidase domain